LVFSSYKAREDEESRGGRKKRELGQEPRKKDRTRGGRKKTELGGGRENRGEKNWKSWGIGPENQRQKKRAKNTEEQKKQNPENGGKIPKAKTETNALIKLRKPTIDITVFSIPPLQIGNKKERRKKGGSKKTGSVFLALPWSQNASK